MKKGISEILFGRQTVEEFLKIGVNEGEIKQILITSSLVPSLGRKMKSLWPNCSFQILTRAQIGNLYPKLNHQGIIIQLHSKASLSNLYGSTLDWQNYIKQHRGPLLLLDSIQDPMNLGSMIRSSEAMGVKALFITGKGVSLSETVHKVSSGASLHLPIFSFSNLYQLIQRLKRLDFWICSADNSINRKGQKSLKTHTQLFLTHEQMGDLPDSKNIALVIGHEGKGIRNLILKESEFIVSIPLVGKTSSLNAGVAAAILIDRLLHRDQLRG